MAIYCYSLLGLAALATYKAFLKIRNAVHLAFRSLRVTDSVWTYLIRKIYRSAWPCRPSTRATSITATTSAISSSTPGSTARPAKASPTAMMRRAPDLEHFADGRHGARFGLCVGRRRQPHPAGPSGRAGIRHSLRWAEPALLDGDRGRERHRFGRLSSARRALGAQPARRLAGVRL
jgi:hypothetical protein